MQSLADDPIAQQVVVNIDGTLYTLEGLIKAYKDLLDTYNTRMSERVANALGDYLRDNPLVLTPAVEQVFARATTVRTELVDKLCSDDRFMSNLQETVYHRLEHERQYTVTEQVRSAATDWWNNRTTALRELVKDVLSEEIRSRHDHHLNLESAFFTMVRPWLTDHLKMMTQADSNITEMITNKINSKLSEIQVQIGKAYEVASAPAENQVLIDSNGNKDESF